MSTTASFKTEPQSFVEEYCTKDLEPEWRGAISLDRVDVVIITSGHDAMDHRVYAKQARSLKQLGANVTIVASRKVNATTEVPVLAVPRPTSRLARFLWQPWRCLWAARKYRADIIHFHDAEMLAALPLAKLWWRECKFVYDVHDDFANLILIRDWLPRWAKPVVRIVTNIAEKTLALLADAIVAVTPPLAAKFPNRQKTVAYNYVPQAFFEQAAKFSRPARHREFDLVHLGTLNAP